MVEGGATPCVCVNALWRLFLKRSPEGRALTAFIDPSGHQFITTIKTLAETHTDLLMSAAAIFGATRVAPYVDTAPQCHSAFLNEKPDNCGRVQSICELLTARS